MSMTKMTTCLPCMQENPDCVTEINTVGWIEILAGRPLAASRTRERHSGARFSIHWLKLADKRRKARLFFVDNFKRLSTTESIDHRLSRPSTSSNESLQILYHFPLPPPIRKSCGLCDRPCRVVNMKHRLRHIPRYLVRGPIPKDSMEQIFLVALLTAFSWRIIPSCAENSFCCLR
ncbi:hypothetical protein NA56DRAFT_55788 [Hyaloscypha hepaticicola]|uniref:Uncharacterized protein n=1 Tax=Hyaloscypha hepaticicola TaxID=2082293 RepID=A0A2J6QCD0_9HELO|nr:hypothetical protein NA56DRAFT_55788 [Hyaloscypha hepaticicola]